MEVELTWDGLLFLKNKTKASKEKSLVPSPFCWLELGECLGQRKQPSEP